MVCPTCFCTTVEDVTDLAGNDRRARQRSWDSCFTLGFLLHPRRQRARLEPLALPAVDDAQAGQLDRPVRHLRLRRLRPLHHLVPGRHRHHRGGAPRSGPAMARLPDGKTPVETLEQLLREPRVLSAALIPAHCALLAGCATNVRFGEGDLPVPRGRAGRRVLPDPSRQGRAGDRVAQPRRHHCADRRRGRCGRLLLAGPTLPWQFDARALAPTVRCRLDGLCLRGKCEEDTRLGFDLMQRVRYRRCAAAAGGQAAAARRVRACRHQLSPLVMRSWSAPAQWRVAASRVRAPNVVTLELEPPGGEAFGVPPRPVQHAFRFRRRRGAHLDKRRPGHVPPHRAHDPRRRRGHRMRCVPSSPASWSACEGRTARTGR